MKDSFALDGMAAIDWVVARAAPAIVAAGDGGSERVAFVVRRDDDAFNVIHARR